MNVTGFTARADIVGRRIRVAWEFVPETGESLADLPPVRLRRKRRDYAFPATTAPDRFLVYDSAAFPPAPVTKSLIVTDLDGWETSDDTGRHVFEPISVAVNVATNPGEERYVEVLRRTTETLFDAGGAPLRQRVEIVDVGDFPGALLANEVYYYQLFGADLPAGGDAAGPYRDAAMVTDSYGQNRTLYSSLPEVYRRHDVTTRVESPGSSSVPELAPSSGQLRRFIDPFGIAADSLRGTAEGLRTLHDVDRVDARFLPLLADWIGWDLSVDGEVPLWRNEIKASSRLYRAVGTLPGLRALVTQSTGWTSRVAEFAQNIARSNQPPRRNLFALALNAGGKTWRGADDAAEFLGYSTSNQEAVGGAAAATLAGTASEPFALRPGMTLTIAADGRLPASVRFGPSDFKDIAQATAAEVATALNRSLPDVRTTVQAGKLIITSQTVGPTSRLEIVPATTSLVSLEGAPRGRLSAAEDAASRVRLFYEAWESPTRPEAEQALPGGPPSSASSGNYVLRRIRYKTFVDGQWLDSRPLYSDRPTAQADPAVVILPDDRVWLAWIDDPQTPLARLRFGIGTSRPEIPARRIGQRREPFALRDGAVLTLRGRWSGADTYTVHAADFSDLAHAKAAEVVSAMNAQLTHVIASRQSNGSISLATKSGGAQVRLAVDLAGSNTARTLGFDDRNAVGPPGSWSDAIDWSPPLDAGSIWPGMISEAVAVEDPAGGIRVAWALHRSGLWRIVTAHWDERIHVATANGVYLRTGAGAWAAVPGLPSNDVRAVAVDANGTAWFATGAGVMLRHLDGTTTTPGAALPSTDVRDVALAPDGTAWFATAAGLASLAPDGTLTTLTTADELPSNDIRALALDPGGALWAGTAAGAFRRGPAGTIEVFDTSSGLPANLVQGIAVDASGSVHLATAGGLAVSTAIGGFAGAASTGPAASDVRAVRISADGTLWIATSAGVGRRSPSGAWTIIDTVRGLPSNDARSLNLAPDGSAWVGMDVGVCVIMPDNVVVRYDLNGGGGANPAVRAVHLGWSSGQELAVGGGGNREPCLTLDATGRTWLIWSRRVAVGDPDDNWDLRYRIYDPVALAWGAESALTSPPAGKRAADRTPAAAIQAAGLRVYFASDRQGGSGLYSVDVSLAGAVGPLVPLPSDGSSDLSPLPVSIGGESWVLYRADANVSLGLARSLTGADASERVPDNGTTRRFAGTAATDLGDLNRMRTRRTFGDLLCYTPNRPEGPDALTDAELYTRGTIGLYVSRANRGADLTAQEAGRLRELIRRFIPINLRVVVIFVEEADEEFIYSPAADLGDSYSDDFPFLSALGPIADSAAVAMPGLSVLKSNQAGEVSADPANLGTLSRRTFFPPLQ